MSMREMRQSGVEWVGSIPERWEVKKGKWFLSLLQRPTKESDEVITCFRDGEVTLRSNRREDGFTISLKEHGYQGIEPGDIVVHGMDGFAGAIGISDSRGKASPVLNVIDTKLNKKFFVYYLRSMAFNGVFLALSTGIRVRSCDTGWNKLKNLPYPIPPLAEQKAISDFLDSKCTEIDALTADIEKQIETLQEYKKSVITEAVTKGLDPNVKVKDSGVEWIGKIPNQWTLSRIKYGANKIGSGKTPKGGANTYVNDGVAFIRSQNVYDTGLTLDNVAFISQETHESMSSSKVMPLDILLNITGGSIGRCCVVPENFLEANVNQHVCIIRADKFMPEWIKFFWNSMIGQYSISRLQGSANRESINFEEIGNTFIPIPPIQEQQRIISFLKDKTEQIDSTITTKQEQLETLAKYKQSLIYEYVTGKKTVPNP